MSASKQTGAPEGKTIEVDGQPIFYTEQGSGEPIILLHGGGPGASGWSNYSRNVAFFANSRRVIVPDLPGFGGSTKAPITGPRFDAYAKAMIGLMDKLKIPKAHVVGNSLGGGTALKMALEAPSRIDKLILMGPAGLASAYTKIPTEGARMIFNYYEDDGPSSAKLEAFIRLMIFDAEKVSKDLIAERYKASIDPEILANPPLTRSRPPQLEELWRDARLAQLPHETLIIWGRDDRVNPLLTADILVNQLPRARLVSLTRCGHWVQWERPEAFNSTVEAFLQEAAA